MNGFYLFIITLVFIVFQTVVLPCFSWFSQSFDLTIMLVLFLSLNFSHYAVVMAIVCIGGIMDSLSGGPFFLYTFSYLWIFMIVQLVKQFVFQTSGLFILVISMVSVVIQQALGVFSVFIQQGEGTVWQMDFTLMIRQVIWGTVLIPPGVWIISVCYENWRHMVRMLKKNREQKKNA